MSPRNLASQLAGLPVPPINSLEQAGIQRWIESRINGGMITTIEPTDIPTSALQLAKNVTVRYDRTTRRNGSSLYTPTKPDSNPILALVYVKLRNGTIYTVRHTPSSIYSKSGSTWDAITGGGSLHGAATDRLNYVDVLNTYCFSNNGADPIQTIDFNTLTVSQLGNAPAYRYLTGFFNRAVGAALQGTDEVQVGWSADGDPTQWDGTVDESAGSSPIVDSPADLSDWIKGIFSFTNVMALLREKSLWLATKQPIPTDPFYFYSAIPGIGCDCPFSAQIVSGGLAWADTRTRSVYVYAPGSPLEPIGGPIEVDLFSALNDLNSVFSAYNATFGEYTIFIPTVGSNIVKGWTYSFRTKTWVYDEFLDITCAADFPIVTGAVSIADLVGTIGGLTGSIADLSPTSDVDTRAYGRDDGDIAVEDDQVDLDAGVNTFETLIVSKTLALPSYDEYITEVRIEYEAVRVGTIYLEYSIDDGATWKSGRTITSVINKPKLLVLKKAIKARRFIWRIRATDGVFSLLSYEVWAYRSGDSRAA